MCIYFDTPSLWNLWWCAPTSLLWPAWMLCFLELVPRAFCELVSELPNCFYHSLLLFSDKEPAAVFSMTTFWGKTLIMSRKRSDSLEWRMVRISVLSPSWVTSIDLAKSGACESTALMLTRLFGFCSVLSCLARRAVEASPEFCWAYSSKLLMRMRRV